MKKLFVVLAIACAIMTGCTVQTDGDQEETGRFKIVISEYSERVYVDTETGVMYFYHSDIYNGGMSVMLDADGKPLIWEGAEQ